MEFFKRLLIWWAGCTAGIVVIMSILQFVDALNPHSFFSIYITCKQADEMSWTSQPGFKLGCKFKATNNTPTYLLNEEE